MDILQLGSLRVRRVVVHTDDTDETHRSEPLTIVLLHGFGAPGDDLVGLASALGAPPGTTLLFPEAPKLVADFVPVPFMNSARAWC